MLRRSQCDHELSLDILDYVTAYDYDFGIRLLP